MDFNSYSSSVPYYAREGYGEYLEKTSVENTTKTNNTFSGGSVSVNVYNHGQVTAKNKGINNLRQTADAIPDINIWTALAKAGIRATAEFYESMSARREQQHLSANYQYQALAYDMQSKLVDIDIQNAQLDIRSATNDIYNTYRMGEYQAMMQGLQDAQIIHGERASTASSGVRMNSESKQEVYKSNVYGAQQNQWAIQENTNSAARSAKMNVQKIMKNMSDLELQKANFKAQEIIAMGNSQAAKIESKSIKPLENAIYAFGLSMANSGPSIMSSFGGKGSKGGSGSKGLMGGK